MHSYDVVESFAKNLKETNDRVQVFDFGEGITVMPIPAPDAGYLASEICYLHISSDKPETSSPFSVERRGKSLEFVDCGNSNFYVGVELHATDTAKEITSALEAAKVKLLEGAKANGWQPLDAERK